MEQQKKDTNDQELMRSMKVSKAVAAMAIPSVISSLVTVVYNMADTFFVGQTGDALQVAAVSLTNPIFILLMAFANMFGMGGSAAASMALGEKKEKRVKQVSSFITYASLIVGIVFAAILLVGMQPVLQLFGADADTYELAKGYTTYISYGAPFIIWSAAASFVVRADGASREAMTGSMIGTVANIILDPIFIYIMGVQGAALATVLSQLAASVWTFKFLTGKNTIIKIKLSAMRCQAKRVKKILVLGLSGFTMSVTNSAVQIACNVSLQNYGSDVYVGVMTIINSIREVLQMPVTGLGNGAQPIIGFNYGAGENGRVKEAIRYLAAMLIIYSTVAWFIILLIPKFLIGIFTADAALITAGVPSLHIYFFGFFLMAFMFTGQTVFVGIGKAKFAIFFSILRKGIVVIPLILLLPIWFGVNGVFLAEPISNLIGGLACFTTMYFAVYRKL